MDKEPQASNNTVRRVCFLINFGFWLRKKIAGLWRMPDDYVGKGKRGGRKTC
jgi:hypothetical protein